MTSSLHIVVLAVLFASAFANETRSLRALAKAGDIATVEQMLAGGMDPNEEDNTKEGKGLAPALWEAAKISDAAMVSLLLQFRANTTLAVDAQTRSVPLLVAVEKNSDAVVRLLLSYGADMDVPNKVGLTPRRASHMASDAIRLLFEIRDRHGPIGLEDPPGTWHLFDDKDRGMPFYFNPITQEARWMKPPSCSWRRMVVDVAQPIYMNEITHQTSWVMPPGLCWKKVDIPGTEAFWLNFKTNVTNARQPAELPNDLAAELEAEPSTYWFNEVTGASQWEDPKESSWNMLQDKEGRAYWFKPSTGDSTYKQPIEAAWKQKVDQKKEKQVFYYNEVTEETTWMKPPELGWVQHDEL